MPCLPQITVVVVLGMRREQYVTYHDIWTCVVLLVDTLEELEDK